MNLIERKLESQINKWLGQGFVLILYGARQVGKTTLVKKIMHQYREAETVFLNCDEFEVREKLSSQDFNTIQNYIGKPKLLVIDEAQRVHNIGINLKLIYDNMPETQIIATGSSSFDLANQINEPLTGRSLSFKLYPFALNEISHNQNEAYKQIDRFLVYGSYPKIFSLPIINIEKVLKEITEQYLYKDLLNFSGIQKSDILVKLLKLLAYQIGNEVSYTKLASNLNIDKKSVEKYIEILEQSFIIFRLNPYSKNLRNELKKLRKIYFYDLGIRNALINNFNDLELRPDNGALWENFAIIEKIKANEYKEIDANYYFWRTHEQKELDLVIDYGQCKALKAYEFKYKENTKYKKPKEFLQAYTDSTVEQINKSNFFDFYQENYQ